MSYTPPAYNAVNATWSGAQAYSAPSSTALNASWVATTAAGQVAVPGPLGSARVTGFSGELPDGQVSAPSPLGTPTLRGARVEMGKLSAASLLGVPSAIGRVIVSARISVPSPLSVTKVVGTVVRYELRGEVRDQGVLVNRRVRAYRRSDGAFIAEADTVAGLFALPVGFASAEYYLVPINLDPAATDYTPPCANRVTSVLAMDVAA